MDSWQVALIDQTNGGAVPPGTLQQYADALQQQVDNDLAPAWDVRADISVLAPGAAIPEDTFPLNIVDSLAGPAGVHADDQGQVSAEAVNDDQLVSRSAMNCWRCWLTRRGSARFRPLT